MAARQSRPTYHHGNLRERCVEVGLDLLARKGKTAVTLRAVARRCRVSPRAPYQHFRDKTEFLAALAERGFAEFEVALQRSDDGLRGFAAAYLEFAATHPALMQLMFGDDFEEREARNPELDQAAKSAFALLERAIGAARPGVDARARRVLAALAWSLVHGLSELQRHGQLAQVLASEGEHRDLLRVGAALFEAPPRAPAR